MTQAKQAFKLFKLRRNGTLGSLFINRRTVLPEDVWMEAESHPTKGFAVRPGWHATEQPVAPHLSMRGRIWKSVLISDYVTITRPKSQGGIWYVANKMIINNNGSHYGNTAV